MATQKTKREHSKFKKAVVGVGLASLLAAGGIASYAGFTDTSNANVTVGSGTVDLKLNDSESTTLAFGSGWLPGKSDTKTVTVKNAGNLPLKYTVAAATPTTNTLANKLTAKVTINGATTTAYNGALSGLSIPTASAQSLAPGATHTFKIDVNWTEGADDNNYQGKSGDTVLTFSAMQ